METIDISHFDDQIVLHFGTPKKRINAYTLASTLVSIADAAKAANSSLNQGYNIEIVVEAFGEGSFRAKLKAVYTEARNLFSKQNLQSVALSVIAAVIYEHALSPDDKIEIHIHDDSVIIEQNDTKIIVPRDVYEACQEVKKTEKFRASMSKTFSTIDKDPEIENFTIVESMNSPTPPVTVNKERFAVLADEANIQDEENTRIITENADLQILRAILERSKRRWEFSWRGVRIPAPVLDNFFYDEFFAHSIRIAPGDTLSVELKIFQIRDPDTGIYTNSKYEVMKVHNHSPKMDQTDLIDPQI